MPPVSLGFTPVTRPYDAPLLRGVDDDTINIDQAVRMVSIDTPESRLGARRATAQRTLDRCRNRLEAGEFDEINSRCASICSTGCPGRVPNPRTGRPDPGRLVLSTELRSGRRGDRRARLRVADRESAASLDATSEPRGAAYVASASTDGSSRMLARWASGSISQIRMDRSALPAAAHRDDPAVAASRRPPRS